MLLVKPFILWLEAKRSAELREKRGGDRELVDKVAYRKFIEEKVQFRLI